MSRTTVIKSGNAQKVIKRQLSSDLNSVIAMLFFHLLQALPLFQVPRVRVRTRESPRSSLNLIDQVRKTASSITWPNPKVSLCNAASGALLGPLLDNYHSMFGVLVYQNPMYIHIAPLFTDVTTKWWVFVLFGIAGLGIGNSVLVWDQVFGVEDTERVGEVLVAISAYCFVYYLSGLQFGVLGQSNMEILVAQCVLMLGMYWRFDRTASVMFMGLVTAMLGPFIEISLINGFGGSEYYYTRPDGWGIPLWILPVYASGVPAVGKLARLFRQVVNGR